MKKSYRKIDLPLDKIRKYLEPGPIVLVSSSWQGKNSIMTMGWYTVMEFSIEANIKLINNGDRKMPIQKITSIITRKRLIINND